MASIVSLLDMKDLTFQFLWMYYGIELLSYGKKFQWKDGHTYPIDRVCKAERAASTKVGGCGIRYTIMVGGLPRFLYDEDGKWFMEDEVIIEDNG